MKIRSVALGVAVMAALGVSGTAAAGGGGRTTWKNVRVSFQPTGIVDTQLGAPVCDSGGQCVFSSTQTNATQTGDLQGSTVQAQVVGAGTTSPVLPVESIGTFTGTVTGCGTGAFLYRGHGTYNFDTGVGDTVFVIEPGSASGDLAGITGVLTQHSTATDTGAPPISGVVRCAVHR